MKFEGIYTPAITPLTSDGQIDTTAFAEVLEYLIEARVHGVIIGGSTGEYYAQTMQERLDLAALAKEVIGTRLPLIVGTGAVRTEDSVEYAKAARAIKADAILVGSPPYALPTEQENAAHALAIDKAAGLPIMLYNYPGRMASRWGASCTVTGSDQGALAPRRAGWSRVERESAPLAVMKGRLSE